MLFSTVKYPIISENDFINQWTHQWKMEFNPDPTKQATEVLFSCKKSSLNHPQLIFNVTFVAKINEQKHLGLILDSTLSFKKHLKALDQMYKAPVRSHLDYCDIIYYIPSLQNRPSVGVTLSSLMAKAENIQYQAALAVTGAWQGSNRIKHYEKLGWEALSDRRMCRHILQIDNIINNKTTSYLKDKLPPIREAWYNPNHNCDIFQELRSRSNRYIYSFFPGIT